MSAARDELAAWAALGEEEDAERRRERARELEPAIVRRVALLVAVDACQSRARDLEEAVSLLVETLDLVAERLEALEHAEAVARAGVAALEHVEPAS